MKRPACQDQVREALGMIVVHVREEDRIDLLWVNAELRQPHRGSASGVELQVKGVAVIVAAVTDQSAGAGQTRNTAGPPCVPVSVTVRDMMR